MKQLRKDVNDVTTKLNAYLLARDYIDKYVEKKQGAENNE
jgi:hypothetical protein